MLSRTPRRANRILWHLALTVLLGCESPATPHPVVGVWVVRHQGAPFPYHMYVFNADGTMQQANPHAGNPRTSDSDGKGIWIAAGDTVKGKFVEILADRTTHGFLGRGEITYNVIVRGDSIVGTASARFFDGAGAPSDGPIRVEMLGSRVTLR
jgi:hypothetical protein